MVYCSVCETELSRDTITLTAPGHTNSAAVKENVVAPTCCADGSYDLVVRCTVCSTLISSESCTDPKTGVHTWKDNSDGIGASCTTAGCTATAIKQWQKITDVSNLNVGDKIVIVAAGSNAAMSTNQKDNNRGQIAITKSGNYVTINNSVQIFTVQAGKTSGTYAFYTGSGYIFAASSGSNYLRTETTLSNNSSWSVTITSAGVATVKATGSNTKNWLRYNSSSSLFSCYASGQADIALYELVYVECNHSGNTNQDDNNCSTAVKCSLCGAVITEAIEHSYSYACDSSCDNTGCTYVRSVTHTPEEDDGDCTTEINCGVCGVVTTPAAAAHTPNADDDDCTTAVTCSVCDTVVVAAKAHSFTGEYEYDDEGHWHICQNSGCEQLEAKADHISSGEATATEAEVCTACGYIITPMTGCEHTNITVEYSDDQHWEVCDSCGATFNYADHESDEDDGSCLTAVICTGCDYVFVAAKADHTAPSSIADCTEDVLCVDCGALISEGNVEHSITEDNNCETAAVCSICNIVVTPAKTHSYGSNNKCTNENCDQTKPLVTKSYSYTFTSKQFSANGAKTLNGVSWTLAGDGGYWGNDGTKGQQFGSGNAPYKSLTLTSGTSFSNVSKIVINASTANSATATMVVKVNGEQVASQKLTNSATSYTFNVSNITGTVEISITQTTSKALYIKSISITYAE